MKLHNRSMALFMSFFIGLSAVPWPAAYAQETPTTILIRTAEDFIEFAGSCSREDYSDGSHVILKADIDLSGTDFVPVPLFCGIFEGEGHTITGVDIRTCGADLGLFRYIDTDAVIRNLNVEGNICPSDNPKQVGGIAGVNKGLLEHCSFSGTVSGKNVTGGIVGCNESTGQIISCLNQADLIGTRMTGGIAGQNDGLIEACSNLGEINTIPNRNQDEDEDEEFEFNRDKLRNTLSEEKNLSTGGIAGMSEGIIRQCINQGTVGYERTGYYVGGIAGRQNGQLIQCENYGKITGRRYVGGIAGQLEPSLQITYETDTIEELEDQLDRLSDLKDDLSDTMDNTTDKTSDQLDRTRDTMHEIHRITKNFRSDQMEKRDTFRTSANLHLDDLEVLMDDLELDLSSRSAQNASSRIRRNIKRSREILKELVATPSAPDYDFIPDEDWIPDEEDIGSLMSEWNHQYALLAELAGCSGSILEDMEIVLFDGADGVEDGLWEFQDDLDSIREETKTLSHLIRDYMDQFLQDSDDYGDRLSENMDILSDISDRISDNLKEGKRDTRAERDRLDALLDEMDQTLSDGKARLEKERDRLLDEEDMFDDISDGTETELSNGMITECRNKGDIFSESEAGGIVGNTGVRELEDLKDRITLDGNRSFHLVREARAVVSYCRNDGKVTVRANYAGGIAGKMDLGLISDCENYGDVTSDDGDYAGGIAGKSSHMIRSSYSLCEVRGNNYLGGISGFGTDLYNNCAMVSVVSEEGAWLGSISGFTDGDCRISGNSYMDEGLGAIDGISYRSEAAAMTYPELLELPGIPKEFQTLTVTFLCEGKVIERIPCSFGSSIPKEQIPEIPQIEGCYAEWEKVDLSNVRRNLRVNARITPWTTVISTPEEPKALLLAEARFHSDAQLYVHEEDTAAYPVSGYKTADCFTYIIRQNENSVYDGTVTLRVLASGYSRNAEIGLCLDDRIETVTSRRDGDYLVFSAAGSGTFVVLEPKKTVWIWASAAGTLALAGWFFLHEKRKQKR